MKIGIIGAGSIGLLFASYLSSCFNVILYTRTKEQAAELKKNGLLLEKEYVQKKIDVVTAPIAEWDGSEDLTIVTVKQYQLPAFLEQMDTLPHPKNLLFLQNGMGHLKYLEKLETSNVYVGSVEHGALRTNPFSVSHNGEGVINAALFKGDIRPLIHFMESCPINFRVTLKDNYYEMLVNKLLANAVINTLTAILRVKNGELIKNRYYFAALTSLLEEISYILGIQDSQEKLKNITDICKKTADNHSSMLKDLESGRMTEVDSILGFILDEAIKQRKKAVQVESYYNLIKGKASCWEGLI